MKTPNKLERIDQLYEVQKALAEGKSQKTIVQELADKYDLPISKAYGVYWAKLKELAPAQDQMDEIKRGIIQANLNRIEKIIEENINGSTNQKKLALDAIKEINKLMGAYQNQNITVMKSDKGDELIRIEFDN